MQDALGVFVSVHNCIPGQYLAHCRCLKNRAYHAVWYNSTEGHYGLWFMGITPLKLCCVQPT